MSGPSYTFLYSTPTPIKDLQEGKSVELTALRIPTPEESLTARLLGRNSENIKIIEPGPVDENFLNEMLSDLPDD